MHSEYISLCCGSPTAVAREERTTHHELSHLEITFRHSWTVKEMCVYKVDKFKILLINLASNFHHVSALRNRLLLSKTGYLTTHNSVMHLCSLRSISFLTGRSRKRTKKLAM